jgi:hypothetical protein
MFPGRKLRSEASEAGSGQAWQLGPIDLESGVVEVHRTEPERHPEDDDEGPPDADAPPPTLPGSG